MQKTTILKAIIGLFFSLVIFSCGDNQKTNETSSNSGSSMAQTEKAALAVSTAKDYIGTPYKSAGVDKEGVDASALTMLSWKAAGVKLARIAQEQSRQGQQVVMDQVSSGDLVFFAQNKGGKQVSLCGIVTKKTAQGFNFIYTSSKDGVKETAFSPYWKDRLVVIKRVG
ncbi:MULTISPECIES: C40 family peptidase [Flammeovirga]|uniref:C40 family peptidase n=1 Tax=Flammeovirga agarivorans TaxID=2726742 RepID=A0A7X8SJ54_9BACT|nr:MULTISPECIES: NlpC/P60 family protein [Flammeovirga]NLR91213.1 C40 family peptidase [Flammeovirga agarivorans]